MSASSAEKTKPGLWERIKRRITGGDKGGKPGQWSARKAQLATREYKKEGGGYKGKKQSDNSLHQWTKEDWGTKSGKKSEDTGERYLPKKARDGLSKDEYAKTSAKKRTDTKKGKQFSSQPKDIAEKTAGKRATGKTTGSVTKAQATGSAKTKSATAKTSGKKTTPVKGAAKSSSAKTKSSGKASGRASTAKRKAA